MLDNTKYQEIKEIKIGTLLEQLDGIFRGMPQGSLSGLLLFFVFFFVEKSEICNFGDLCTLHSCRKHPLPIKGNFTA